MNGTLMERIALRPARYKNQQLSLRRMLILKDEPRSVSADVAEALGLQAGDAIEVRACLVGEDEKACPAFSLFAEEDEADWLVRNYESLMDEFPRLWARGKVVCGTSYDVMYAGEDDFIKTPSLHWGILLTTCPQATVETGEERTAEYHDAFDCEAADWGKFQLPSGIIRWTEDRDDEELDADEFVQLVSQFTAKEDES